MCGISGIFHPHGLEGANDLIKSMTGVLHHRGPDAEGFYHDEFCTLGHTRLSIIDLNTRSNQPMWSADGRYVMVYNGEVYNYIEIGEKLMRDHGEQDHFHLKTSGDSEIVLEAFARYGERFVDLLNGMFAIAIYDTFEHELYLFRDRLGIKPLFFYYKEGKLAFASELKALMNLDFVDDSIYYGSIRNFLQLGFVPAPDTIYNHVYKIPGGCYVKINKNGLKTGRYWNLLDKIEAKPVSDMDVAAVNVSDLLLSSVKLQLRSDVPFGIFLSGGVDSSLITAQAVLMANQKMNTFSISFDQKKFDEAPYAKAVADYLGTQHHEFRVTHNEALSMIEEILHVYDEPFIDSSCIPTMLVSRLAKTRVTVALSGEGGDELFFGYGSHQWARRLGLPMASMLRHPMKTVFELSDERFKRIAELLNYKQNDNLLKHIFGQEQYLFSREWSDNMLSHGSNNTSGRAQFDFNTPEYSYSYFEKQTESGAIKRGLSRMEMQALYDLHLYLQEDLLTKVDRASMKYSLETRVPYLDHRLVEYAVNISPELKYKHGIPKYILKEILYHFLPEKIFQRPKQGFSIPLEKWLSNELRHLIDEYLSRDKIERHGVFNWEAVKSIINRFDSGERRLYNKIWALFMVQKWLDEREAKKKYNNLNIAVS